MALHVFVALLQAYIFMLLTMIYVSGAVAEEEH
jgi:F0F1-type ATP synthase membrane subunit a